MEDILSYRIKRQFSTKSPSQSLKILQDLSTSCPEAQDVYTKVSEPFDPKSEDYYVQIRTSFPVDRKILWLRVALLEGKLAAILDKLAANCRY